MYTGRKLMIEILVAEDDEMIANLIKINLVKGRLFMHMRI